MQYEELVLFIKNVIRELLKTHQKSKVISATLGHSLSTLFNRFVEEDDCFIGIKPLKRMLDNMGYDLLLIPVPRNDNDFKQQLDDYCRETFIKHFVDLVTSAVEEAEKTVSPRPSGKVSSAIDDAVKNIIKSL